jgi:hypothetical protein
MYRDELNTRSTTSILRRVERLLCDGRIDNGVMQPVSRQRIGKHIPAAMNSHTTIELLLETVFSTRSVQSGYKEEDWGDPVSCKLRVSSVWESVKMEPEGGKLKNLRC